MIFVSSITISFISNVFRLEIINYIFFIFIHLPGAKVNVKDAKWLTPLHRACATGSEACIRVLLDYKADVNARDKSWQIPLHIVAAHNFLPAAG